MLKRANVCESYRLADGSLDEAKILKLSGGRKSVSRSEIVSLRKVPWQDRMWAVGFTLNQKECRGLYESMADYCNGSGWDVLWFQDPAGTLGKGDIFQRVNDAWSVWQTCDKRGGRDWFGLHLFGLIKKIVSKDGVEKSS